MASGKGRTRWAGSKRKPHSSKVSRMHVQSRSGSPGSRRPPGRAKCPDQGSLGLMALRSTKYSGFSPFTRIRATAAVGSGPEEAEPEGAEEGDSGCDIGLPKL